MIRDPATWPQTSPQASGVLLLPATEWEQPLPLCHPVTFLQESEEQSTQLGGSWVHWEIPKLEEKEHSLSRLSGPSELCDFGKFPLCAADS